MATQTITRERVGKVLNLSLDYLLESRNPEQSLEEGLVKRGKALGMHEALKLLGLIDELSGIAPS